jgi:hypothetical protein
MEVFILLNRILLPIGSGDFVEMYSGRLIQGSAIAGLAQSPGEHTDFPKLVSHFLGTKLQGLTASLEETINLGCDLLDKDLVLTLMAECERGSGNERVDTIGAIGYLLLILRSEQCNKLRLDLRCVHEATSEGICHGMGLERQPTRIEPQPAYLL